MGLIYEDGYTIELLLGVFALVYAFYYFWTFNYDYWKKRGVHFLEPTFPLGNTYPFILQTMFIGQFFKDLYDRLEGHKLGGYLNVRNPQLIVRDPELIKHILTKDFNHFVDRGVTADIKFEPILGHLFNMKGDPWRSLRAKLSPTFTSGKMKMMFHIMKSCADHLRESLAESAGRNEIIDLKDYSSRFGMDVIGSCAFGLDIGAINEPDNNFRKYLTLIFKQSYKAILRNFLNQIFPGLANKMKVRSFSNEGTEFFFDFVRQNVEYREKTDDRRGDFLNLLIQIKNKGRVDIVGDDDDDDDDVDIVKHETANGYPNQINNERAKTEPYLNNESLTAQCFIFFIAGFETSSTTLSFCLHELAINKRLQTKLRTEIDTVLSRHDGKISYESLKEMTYMDNCVSEALRKYPPVSTLLRECVKEYKVPGMGFTIEKARRLIIPLFGLHYDPKYYPDPYTFNPDRFTEEAKKSRPNYTWLPFGEGPRICIGMRFGLMQVKMGLATLLSNYEFDIPPNTKLPLEFDPKSVTTSAKDGIKLKITKRRPLKQTS